MSQLRQNRRNKANSKVRINDFNQNERFRMSKRELSSKFNGSSIRVDPDPSSIVDRPWNNVTVSLSTATTGVLNMPTFLAAFLNQVLSPRTDILFDFRFQELRAWELSGARLSGDIYDLDGSDSTATGEIPTVHRSQRDEPGRNHWASIGMKWSASQSNNTLLSSDQIDIASFDSSADTPEIRIHLRIIWRAHRDVGPAKFLTVKE